MDTNFGYSNDPIKAMLDEIGLTAEDQAVIYQRYDLPRIQRHAAQTIYCMHYQANTIRSPIAWFKASIRGNWNPPPGFDAPQRVLTFHVDSEMWMRMETEYPCAICHQDHPTQDCPAKKGE